MITATPADPRSAIAQGLVEEAEEDEEIALDEDFCGEEEDDRDSLQKAQPQRLPVHSETALRPYIWIKGDTLYVAIHRLQGVQVRPGVSGDGKDIRLGLHFPGLRREDLGPELADTLVDHTGVDVARDSVAIYEPLSGLRVRDPKMHPVQPQNKQFILITYSIIRDFAEDAIYNSYYPM
jgi:hypothetical protein